MDDKKHPSRSLDNQVLGVMERCDAGVSRGCHAAGCPGSVTLHRWVCAPCHRSRVQMVA